MEDYLLSSSDHNAIMVRAYHSLKEFEKLTLLFFLDKAMAASEVKGPWESIGKREAH